MFDTADRYQGGRAEEVLGRALSVFSRESYLVASKVYFPTGNSPLERGLSRKHIFAQIDRSLRRLGLDHIDLYQCHSFDNETPIEETARAMNDLIRLGKILYWGVSNWSADDLRNVTEVCRRSNLVEPVSDQLQYSALWREAEAEILPTCQTLGLGSFAWSPLAMGVLSGKYLPGVDRPDGSRGSTGLGEENWVLERYFTREVLEAVQEFSAIAEKLGQTPAQLALGWCLRQPSISTAIVGVSRVSQLNDNIAAADIVLDPATVDEIDRVLGLVAVG